MSENPVQEETDTTPHEPFSDTAAKIADDPSIDDGTAMRQILSILVAVSENVMVSLWDVSEALQLRTIAGKKQADG